MTRASLAAVILATGGGVAAVHSQGLTGVTFSISQDFGADTNYQLADDSPGTSVYTDTRLGLDLVSETETQIFTLGVDTGVRALWEAGEDFEFTFADPSTARVGYGLDWLDSSFDTFLRYSQTNLDTVGVLDVIDGIPITPDNLQNFSGTQQRYDAGFALALRTDAPSSYRFELNANQTDFKDVPTGEDGDSVPTTDVNGNALWTLRLTPLLSSQVLFNYDFQSSDDAADTEIRNSGIDAGLTYAPNEVLSVTAGIGYADYERTGRERNAAGVFSGPRRTIDSNTGPEIRGLILYDLPYIALEANARVSTAAPETRLTGDFVARYDLPRGQLRASAFQNYNLDNTGDEVLSRGFGLGVVREINRLSQVSFDLALATEIPQDEPDQFEPDQSDTNRLDATLAYGFALTQDVSANLGYRLRLRDDNPGDSANSSAVFFSIGRSFSRQP